jgi:thioredoxin reductase (NADPH)
MAPQGYDLIVVGAGPAGLTAGIYAGRIRIRTLILEGELPGGRAVEAGIVESFPGFPEGISGFELMQRMTDQAKRFGVEIEFPRRVVNVEVSEPTKVVSTKTTAYQSRALVISTGTQRKKLLVPGELEFLGRGVSYCPLCDGAFFRDLVVTVIGSGDDAANDALFLTGIARKVVLISSEETIEMSEALDERVQKERNLRTLLNKKVAAVQGNTSVTAIRIVDTKSNEEQEIPTDAVFISLGSVPMTGIVQKAGIETDQRGCITVDRRQRTNIEGVLAAGDCTCGGMQIVTAAGEGAAAAIGASVYIKQTRK